MDKIALLFGRPGTTVQVTPPSLDFRMGKIPTLMDRRPVAAKMVRSFEKLGDSAMQAMGSCGS